MFQIAVCDDNPIHLKRTTQLVEAYFQNQDFDMTTFPCAEDLHEAVVSAGLIPDIAILDIEMREESGISLAEKLNLLCPDCQIIFLSGHADFASEVYETRHIWFVLKEQADRYLPSALDRAILELSAAQSDELISVQTGGTTVILPFSDVLYVERVGRKYQIVTVKTSLLVSRQPEQLLGQMLRCHQGYWVNLARVQALDHNEFVLLNGKRIALSRTFREAARTAFFDQYRI